MRALKRWFILLSKDAMRPLKDVRRDDIWWAVCALHNANVWYKKDVAGLPEFVRLGAKSGRSWQVARRLGALIPRSDQLGVRRSTRMRVSRASVASIVRLPPLASTTASASTYSSTFAVGSNSERTASLCPLATGL